MKSIAQCIKETNKRHAAFQAQQRRRDEGFCIDCDNPARPAFLRCGPCQERAEIIVERERQRLAKKYGISW